MLPKCSKKHPKMTPKGPQMAPRGAQRRPKGTLKGPKSRLFEVPVAHRSARRPTKGPHGTIWGGFGLICAWFWTHFWLFYVSLRVASWYLLTLWRVPMANKMRELSAFVHWNSADILAKLHSVDPPFPSLITPVGYPIIESSHTS